MTYLEKETLKDLSKQVFGTTSRAKKIMDRSGCTYQHMLLRLSAILTEREKAKESVSLSGNKGDKECPTSVETSGVESVEQNGMNSSSENTKTTSSPVQPAE